MWAYLSSPLISKKGLKHLDSYSFHGQDFSWLAAHGLNAFWNFVVDFVPLWVAPNLLTLFGFLCQIAGFVLMSYYNPDFATPAPAWVYFACAFGLFAYQTLDNIDGKQARRTMASSPLGELFDHVSDAMGVGTLVVTIGASCQVGPVLTLTVFFSVITPFFLYHWEEYFTGELILGEFDGPTESQAFVIVMHCLNGFFVLRGIDFWHQTIFGVQTTVIFAIGFCVLCFLSSIKLQVRMWNYVLTRTRVSIPEAFAVGLPFMTFLASALVYSIFSPELLHSHRWDESRLLFFVLTIIFGYITSRLIVQRVCKEKAPVMYSISVPLFLAAVHALAHRFFDVPHFVDQRVVLKVLATLALIQCGIFFYQLDSELTGYLGINTFSLTEKQLRAIEAKQKSEAASSSSASSVAASRGRRKKVEKEEPESEEQGEEEVVSTKSRTSPRKKGKETPSSTTKKKATKAAADDDDEEWVDEDVVNMKEQSSARRRSKRATSAKKKKKQN